MDGKTLARLDLEVDLNISWLADAAPAASVFNPWNGMMERFWVPLLTREACESGALSSLSSTSNSMCLKTGA